MTTPTDTPNLAEESPEISLGRRQLLKALAASSGAIAASTILPGQWTPPVIEAGVLPAHAQTSPVVPPPPPPPAPPVIAACGGVSNFLGSTTEVEFDDDERISHLFAVISPIPPGGTLIRFDVAVNGNPVAIDDTPPTLPVVATDATGLADFDLTTPFPITVRPIVGNAAGFDELAVGDIVSITFSFEPPVDPSFNPTPCVANFILVDRL
jgi:hypothetical protein